jgi:hypothetical protein
MHTRVHWNEEHCRRRNSSISLHKKFIYIFSSAKIGLSRKQLQEALSGFVQTLSTKIAYQVYIMVHILTDSFILVSRPILGIKTNSPLNYLGCAEMASQNWLPPNGMPFSLEILLSKDGK